PKVKEHLQRLFDNAANGLLNQMKKSTSPDRNCSDDFSCMYRGDTGTKCAIGFSLSDEDAKSLEGASAGSSMVQKNLGIEASCHYEMRPFIIELQQIHDSNEPEQWKELFIIFATKYELVLP